MSTREELPDFVQRNIRAGISDPFTMSEMLPGAPIGMVLPNAFVSRDEIVSDLDELENTAGDIESNLTSGIVNSYSDVNRDVSAITSNVIGDIANGLETIESLIHNSSTKVANNARGKLAEAYAKLVDLGFNIPTIDDVRYGIASGDYMGSMTGLTPETDKTVTPIVPHDIKGGGNTFELGGNPDVNPYVDVMGFGLGNAPPPDSGLLTTVSYTAGCLTDKKLLGVTASFTDNNLMPLSGGSYAYKPWIVNDVMQGTPQSTACLWYIDYKKSTDATGTGKLQQMQVWLPMGYFLVRDTTADVIFGKLPPIVAPYENVPCATIICCEPHCNESPPPPPPPPPPPLPETLPVCPVPNYSCPAEYGWKPKPFIGKGEEFCETIEGWNANTSNYLTDMSEVIGMSFSGSGTSLLAQGMLYATTGSTKPVFPDILKRGAEFLQKYIKDSLKGLACENDKLIGPAITLSAASLINQYTSAVPPQTIRQLTQLSNHVCQSVIPTGPQADEMFLAETINKAQWECFQKANGNYVSEFQYLFQAKRTRVDAFQLSQLFRRKQLTKDQYEKKMRGNGVLKPEDVNDIFNTTQSWPGMSDVIRFLVRDVADKDLVDKFGMYEDFEKKYDGRLIEYADAIGVGKDLMKDQWAAHWHIPSFTMLSEMLHRLRPGEVAEDLQVTQDDVFQALKQDDWLPYWAKRMIEVSYRVVAKTDAVRAYMIHTIDNEQLEKHYMDVGYNQESARFYVKYNDRRRELADAKASGLPTIRMLTRQYANCEITETEYRDNVAKLALSEEHEAKMLEAGRLAVKVAERKVSVAQVKRPFELGLLDYDEATTMLSNTDIDPRCVRSLVDAWALKQLKRSKHLAAGQLCKMRERGIIAHVDHVRALVRNNWDRADAERIALECDITVSEKAVARARREADRAQRIREKLARQEAKRLKLEACGPPLCPANTPGGKLDPPNFVPDSGNL